MAVEARKSTPITNRDAEPKVLNDSAVDQGMLRECVATLEAVSGDSIASTYRMLSIPSNARVSELIIDSDDIGTTTVADFGIYQTTENGGAVVDADHFASALSLKDGALANQNIAHESGVFGLEDAEKPLWEALGLSADSNRFYDIVATLTGAADAGGTITLKCRYAI